MFTLVPIAHAAVDTTALGKVLDPIITNVIDPVVWLLFAVAVVVFAFGVFQMVWNKTDADAHKRGRYSMIGGVIGMFIMLSAWGIINLISATLFSL